ncbi:MAG: ABC transporter transmembrane domain-containing protein [Alphaproteobacteria bacterium]|nr:ABC transporter transmembrane domain-containing protein [Alphaproteobacteria bacterium]
MRPGARDDRPASRRIGALRPILGYLAPYRSVAAGAAVALVIAAGTVLALGAGLRHLVDEGFVSGDGALLDQAVMALLGVVALMAVATYARFSLVTWLGERVVSDLRRDVFAHVLTLSPGFYETTRTAEISSRLTVDTEIIQTVVGSSISVALRNVLLLIGGLVLLMITSPKLTLLVLLVVPLVLLPILTFGRRVRRLSRDSQDRIAQLSVTVQEALSGIRTVQAFTQEPAEQARFGRDLDGVIATARLRIRARALLTACVIFLVFGAISVILWIGGRDVLAGRISAGELSAFVFYAAVVAGAVGALSEVMGELQRAAGAAERLFELLATEPDIKAPASPLPLPTPARGLLEMEEVTFFYPSRPDRPALDRLTVSIAAGETVALVGPSGAGKTTVFQLLLRFYDPQQGVIRLDGVDIARTDPLALRRRIGVVPQDPVIFATSAADNIRYGRPDASDAEVRAAAAAAYADEFIERLPEGYDTALGERGVKLSGGQRQRIAIARAILRDPALLLLDEATSALDAESERIVQAALDRLMRGRTTLVVAHRLATVVSADRLLVMDRGRVVETGTHAALVREGGLYARLAALQFDHASINVEAD